VRPVAGRQQGIQAADVDLDGVLGDAELAGDLAVRVAAGNAAQDIRLLRGDDHFAGLAAENWRDPGGGHVVTSAFRERATGGVFSRPRFTASAMLSACVP